MNDAAVDFPHDRFFLDHLQSVQANNAWYYKQRFLGRGGNGTAFLVTCTTEPNYGMQFVLKVFHKISDPTRQNAFLREITHLRNLNHPGIIRVFDEGVFTTSTGHRYPFSVVEYMPTTVRQLLISNEVTMLRAIRIALNCLSALNSLHSSNPSLVHRDIKPENIFISEAGAKLADFGLAKTLDDENEDESLDPVRGTQWPGMPYRYRTPELVQRAIDSATIVTTASDIYQFGTVFYELLTGFNPQIPPESITDPIQLDIRDIHGTQGVALLGLIRSMTNHDASERPNAHGCLLRLNQIHQDFCSSMFRVVGIEE